MPGRGGGPACSIRRRGRPAVTFQRGTTDCEKTAIWEDSKTAHNQCREELCGVHSSHATRVDECQPCDARKSVQVTSRRRVSVQEIYRELEIPALCFRDKKISEHLHTCDRLQFFRINEIRIERDRIVLREQLHQSLIFFDQVIR